jgi:hypothetical protein
MSFENGIDHKKKPLHSRTRGKTFVPLAYKNRPHLGICGNSEYQSTYLYYYIYLFQNVPEYLLAQFAVLRGIGSTPIGCATYSNGLQRFY